MNININQITVSPPDGHSFSFQHCIGENISTKLFLHFSVGLHFTWPIIFSCDPTSYIWVFHHSDHETKETLV